MKCNAYYDPFNCFKSNLCFKNKECIMQLILHLVWMDKKTDTM